MAKVGPYHTITDEVSYGQRNVYHNDDHCPDGLQIEAKNWRSGTDGRPLCDWCKAH
jgi:hypothetical protein